MIRPLSRPAIRHAATRLVSTYCGVALIAVGLLACGPTRPVLPQAQARGPLPTGDAEAGARLLRDRTLGRTGFACADCHPVDVPRPGPRLRALPAPRVDWCVERFMRRPPLSAQQLADLQAAPSAPATPQATAGADLYAQQCAHCHEGGPAPPVLGLPWPRDHLRAVIRGTDRPAHPDTLMPAFSPTDLDEKALKRLVDHVVSLSATRPAHLPGHVGLSVPRMMVGSR